MNICVISSTTYPCPPTSYGGEIFYWDLCCGFSDLGHNVTLYAAPGSKVPPGGKLCYLRGSYGNMDPDSEWLAVDWYISEILENDMILDCSHTRAVSEEIYCFYPDQKHKLINVLNGVSVPRIPYNIVVGSKKWQELMERGVTQFKGTPWEFLYGAKHPALNNGEILGYTHWACNTTFYTPGDDKKEDYFLWMARTSPYKGLHKVLELAVDIDFPLKLIMPVKMAEHA